MQAELPAGSVQFFVHPIEGKRKDKPESLDKIGPRLFGPRHLREDLEVSLPCQKCGREFHVAFFSQKRDLDEFYAPEFQGIRSRPLADRLLDLFPLPYPLSSLLLSFLLWVLWAAPVSILAGGQAKVVADFGGFLAIPSLAIIIFAIRLHVENLERFKNPIKNVLGVKDPKLAGWVYERFRCVILPRPGNVRLVDLTAFLGVVVLVVAALAGMILKTGNAPNGWFETIPSEGLKFGPPIVYNSYIGSFFVTLYWCFVCFLFGAFFYLALSTSWVIYKIGLWFPLKIDPLDQNGGVKPLGDLAISGIVPLIAAELFLVPVIAVSDNMLQVITLGSVTTVTFVLFLSSLFSIHEGMKTAKEEAQKSVGGEYRKAYQQLLRILNNSETIGKEKLGVTNELLPKIEFFEKRIQTMRTWPFDVKLLYKVTTASLLPLVLFALQQLIVYLLPH